MELVHSGFKPSNLYYVSFGFIGRYIDVKIFVQFTLDGKTKMEEVIGNNNK